MKTQHLPRVSRDKDLWEPDDVGAIARSLLDEADDLGNTALQVVPDRLGLNGGDFDGTAVARHV